MATLVLKGHATRGKEVINLLEMLGANRLGYKDTFIGFYYYIECGAICSSDEYPTYSTIFTLEEFEEKYPYKVGDKVLSYNKWVGVIESMEWCNSLNEVLYMTEDAHVISTEDIIETKTIPSYMDYDIKEEIMEEKGDKAKAPNLVGEDYSGKRFGYKIPKGYEVDCIQNNEIIIKPIKPQYPKSYKDCCNVVNASPCVALVYDIFSGQTYSYDIDNLQIYENLRKLLICRDAYWKIAGEQMKLGKPWEPDWESENETYFTIAYDGINIKLYNNTDVYAKFVFPTAEMQDEFYENFKELIEQCKELL